MPTGDPMWTCPFCKQTYYAANQTSCSCKGWMDSSNLHNHTFAMPGVEAVEKCGVITDTDEDVVLHEKDEFLVARKLPETLVVNLHGGSGTGKTPMAAGIFFELKALGINVALRQRADYEPSDDQIYIFGNEYHRLRSLLGRVEIILTDCPLLLSPVYDKEHRSTLEKLVLEEHNKMWTYNVFLKRKKNVKSTDADVAIINLLDKYDIAYEVFEATAGGKDAIVKKILMLLEWRKREE
jgi:hypothetical protein